MAPNSTTPRGNSGPGRDTPRSRATGRPGERSGKSRARNNPAAPSDGAPGAKTAVPLPGKGGLNFTKRFVAVIVVVCVLLVSYASSLRVWFNQERALAATRQEIAQRKENIATLEDELARWKDPAYVKAQARERLGWVMPGEVGYRVIGPDGQPLGGGSQIDRSGALPSDEHPTVWWEKLWGSVRAADNPAPVTTPEKTISPTPAPSPTKSR